MRKQATGYSLQSIERRHVHAVNGELSTVNFSRGFTVIELLVVTAIIILLSGVILASSNRLGGRVLLQNLAYDVALSMRQAQVYGVAGRRDGSATYSPGFGMHFDMDQPKSYSLFSDTLTHDGIYEPTEDISPSPFNIGRGFVIKRLCAPAGTALLDCTPVSRLDILFVRPEPDAFISTEGTPFAFDSKDHVVGTAAFPSARIVLSSPRGDMMSVIVSSNGQINVTNN
jgi:type II secretory pathway pseudopilin PulG